MSSPCSRHTRQQKSAAAKKPNSGKDTPIITKGKKIKKSGNRTDSPYLPRKIKSEPLSPIKSENQAKLSISKTEIKISNEPNTIGDASLNDDTPLSNLDEIFSNSSESIGKEDTLTDMEITSDELGDVSLPVLSIPDEVRSEAGPNWRMKEALLNSYHFGKTTIKATDFARSQSEIKTAEILADKSHSLESKKYFVKIHLGMSGPKLLFQEFFFLTQSFFSKLPSVVTKCHQLHCLYRWQKKI